MFPVKKLWTFSTVALLTVVLPTLPITYQGGSGQPGNLDELVTLVLMHKALWPVLGEMPNISQPTAWLGTHACRMSVGELCSGNVFLEVTDETKVTQLVRKDLILALKVSIRHMEWKVFRVGEDLEGEECYFNSLRSSTKSLLSLGVAWI